MESMRALVASMFVVIVAAMVTAAEAQGTVVGFYRNSCPSVERLIQLRLARRYSSDKSIVPALLRMHFHDCFVRGCDASVLLDSTAGNRAEKEAGPNQTLRGFDFIDDVKKIVEAVCPNTVSCADIIALATRDAVALAGGPSYEVATGRRDGGQSKEIEAGVLPAPTDSVSATLAAFTSRGLTSSDMVALVGAHTVGSAHCSAFSDRLYDFGGSHAADPAMAPSLVTALRGTCPNPATADTETDPTVSLDQGTPAALDESFFREVLGKRGILQLDQALLSDPSTAPLVRGFAASPLNFRRQFAQSMVRMGNLGVLTASQGSIRKNCRFLN